MGEVVALADFLDAKIAEHRDNMQLLMLESRLLVDIAVAEGRYDFSKIKQARDVLDKAVWHSNEIKRLEAVSFNVKHKKKA